MVRLLGAGESGLSLIYRINCQNCNYCNYEKKSCIFLPFQNYKSRSKFFEFYNTSKRSIEDSLTLSRNVRMSSDVWPPNNPCSPATN